MIVYPEIEIQDGRCVNLVRGDMGNPRVYDTDPVTAASSNRGRLIYGFGIGLLIFAIREWGSYADGVAFAVLLMNLAVPTIDYLTRPHIVGHPKKRSDARQ